MKGHDRDDDDDDDDDDDLLKRTFCLNDIV